MRAALFTLLALLAPLAWAQQDAPLRLSASYAMQTDSNLFRLPSGANTQALLGKASAAEQIGVSTLGLHFVSTQSLQKFELDASLQDYRYQNFDYLNFAASNYDAAWRWALTPQFTGKLSSKRADTLNSFADYQGFTRRNQRTDTSHRLDAMLEVEGPWRLLAGTSATERSNEQSLVAGGDYRYSGADLGVRYAYASGSSLSLLARSSNGSYLNQVVPSLGLYDDGFTQTDTELRLHWAYSGNSVFDAYVTPFSRSHPRYGQRDYSGVNAGATWGWALSGKTRLNTEYARELAAYATANSNYSQTDRLRAGVQWLVSAKAQLAASYGWAQTDYLGTPTAVPASQRKDTSTDTSLSIGWEALQGLTLSTALQSSSRSSTQAGLDFDSTALTVSAQYRY